jgi:glyoxylate/hydroxypyruvate reductase A
MTRGVLLVKTDSEPRIAVWREAFGATLPNLRVHFWHDPAVDPAEVRYVLVWEPPPGGLAALPNLRLICSIAAGVDHITRDPSWPRHVPIVRMGGLETAQRMAEFVALAVLSMHRDMPALIGLQARREWSRTVQERSALHTRVGVMGLGNLGAHSAAMLRDIGFKTAGWSRSPKSLPGIETFAGAGAFDAFLARTDILVCLLPDTPDVRGIIDARALALLPPGASVVNLGRGSHVVLPDLVAALDAGRRSGAFLDVFATEPLPRGDAIWSHPRIIVTPHIAADASPRDRAHFAANAILAFERGETPPNLYDPLRGY